MNEHACLVYTRLLWHAQWMAERATCCCAGVVWQLLGWRPALCCSVPCLFAPDGLSLQVDNCSLSTLRHSVLGTAMGSADPSGGFGSWDHNNNSSPTLCAQHLLLTTYLAIERASFQSQMQWSATVTRDPGSSAQGRGGSRTFEQILDSQHAWHAFLV